MVEEKYEIWCGDIMLADNMRIDVALILVKALFEEEWSINSELELKIKRKEMVGEEE